MSCDEARELLELYALGALDRGEQQEVAEHLQTGCRDCAQSLRRAVAFNAAVLTAAPDVDPPRRLRSKVTNLVRPTRFPLMQRALVGIAAGLALVVLWLGVDSRRKAAQIAEASRDRDTFELEARRANAALSFLRDSETRLVSGARGAKEPRGLYFVNPTGGVLLIASNLPPISEQRIYQMWVIPKGQDPQPAGLFRPDTGGGAVHLQTGPVNMGNIQALAISVEPEGGSAAPTTTPMLVSPVAN